METGSTPAPQMMLGAKQLHPTTPQTPLSLSLSLISFPLCSPPHPSLICSPLSVLSPLSRSQLISHLQADPGLTHGPSLPSMASSVETHRPRKGRGRGRRYRGEGTESAAWSFRNQAPQTDLIQSPGPLQAPHSDPAPQKGHAVARSQDWIFQDQKSDSGGASSTPFCPET